MTQHEYNGAAVVVVLLLLLILSLFVLWGRQDKRLDDLEERLAKAERRPSPVPRQPEAQRRRHAAR